MENKINVPSMDRREAISQTIRRTLVFPGFTMFVFSTILRVNCFTTNL